ncbi:PREDICTED: U3 small nucleolar RNA-associated protein 14 homolog A isoform X2 [Gavialis gangeticus]|uniref:U3 small nucleolar RNA-associated protein 14 homolog A isoform X2 n=1 Tax=Gavialis gangeticus TaxID=94835 RepID=UPI00092FB06A|nr:PREDICTED: U3 small nucleolar RNA-associated protein 14 homolog A isoform X2 [Gavialis gangeticus]
MADEEAAHSGPAPRAREDEDEDEDQGAYDEERRHRQLLEAVSSLAGRNRRKLTERTEASAQVSEFSVSCEGAGEKLILSELLGPIKTSSLLGAVKKQLNRVKQKKAVELPLSKKEAQRVVREAAYDKTSKAITKWDQVVLQNRRAEQLVFPLKQERVTVAPIEERVTSWQARTPLEQEIFSLLHKTQQLTADPLLTPREEASLQAMSLEEAQQRRAELQKARALQSYYEAKARREKKIKSKKFHRLLQKNKRREALKEFEALKKSNPEAALLKLDEMEKARIKERMTLKHQNKGKWARSKAIMGKYDLEARRAMQEQLAKNKELTQKVCMELEDNKEVCVAEEGLLPDSLNEVQPSRNVANPWMLGKLSNETKDSGTQEDLKAPTDSEEPENEGEEEPVLSEEEALLQDFEQRRVWHCQKGSPELQGASREEELPEFVSPSQAAGQINMEDEQRQEEPLLSEQLGRLCAMEEMDVLASEVWAEEQEPPQPARTEQQKPHQDTTVAADRPRGSQTTRKMAKQKMIDLQAVLAGESCMIHCPTLPVAVQDEEGGTDQRLVIKEAFAGDDVVADFLKEKNKVEQERKPQTLDLLLPGWGEWSGTGLKPSTKKRKRFLIKQPPGPPRKDRHLPHVIISQKRNILAAAHQVNELPFPFDSHQQFERSIQAPIGPTWNTQHAFQKLTAPHLITQPGHIIQPISNEDVASQSTTSTHKAKPAMELTPQQAKRLHQHPRKKV